MPNILERANNLRNSFRRITNQSPEQAIIGDASGVMKYDTTPPSHVECRVYATDSATGVSTLSGPRPIYFPSNINITLKPGTPVLVGTRYGRECILDPNTSAQLASGLDSTTAVAAQQGSSAPQGGLSTLKCIASTPPDLFVHLQGWNVITDGLYTEYQQPGIDLSGYVPSTGEMLYAGIFVLADLSDVLIVTSTPRAANDDPLDATDVNEILAGWNLLDTPAIAVKLIGDQTEITQAGIDIDGKDLRQVVNSASVSGGGNGWTQACRVYNSADESIPDGTFTVVTFDSERYDTDTMHSTSSNTGRITFTTAGIYNVHAQIQWDVPGTNGFNFQAEIRLNGATIIALVNIENANTNSFVRMEIATDYQFAAADYVELLVSQNTGGAFLVKASANSSPEFMAHRVA